MQRDRQTGQFIKESAAARFFRSVDLGARCWEWTGGKNTKGYGFFADANGRKVPAHRFAHALIKGPLPAGYVIDHLCRNPGCVNPAHLEAVTPRENLMRGDTHAARNARKTHCAKGHPYAEANTYFTGAKRRLCRTCIKARNDATAEYRRAYYKKRHHTMSRSHS